jgi:capsular polysaccharide biosynthesis protein
VELRDYLDIVKRRLNVLVLVPALALLLVATATLAKAAQYEATATVAAPALVGGINANQYSGAAGLKTFVANFSAAVTSPPIINKVSSQTGVTKARLHSGLAASEVGASSLMEVHYRTGNRRNAGSVAQAAASETIKFLFNTQVTLAQRPVDGATKALDENDKSIANLIKQTGLVIPDRDYDLKVQAVQQLESAATTASANGQGSTAARIQTVIDAKKAELIALAPQVQTYQTLVDKKNQLINTLNQATTALQQAKAQFEAADPARVVTLGRTAKVSVIGELAQREAAALAGAVLLAAGIVVLLELVGRREALPAAPPVLVPMAQEPEPAPEPYVVRNPFGRTSAAPQG